MKNLKDTLSTIAGVLIAAGTAVLGLPTMGIELPEVVKTVAIITVVVCTAIIGVLVGKNADGTTKQL